MNNSLLLSIIIPAYNAEKFIEVSLPSVMNEFLFEEEMMNKYEIILINDGSKDNTSHLAKEFAKKWNCKTKNSSFMRVIDKENGQYGSVINRGIREAKGKYFKVLDVDDHFRVDAFIDILNILMGLSPEADIIYTDHIFEKVGSDKVVMNTLKKVFDSGQFLNLKDTSFPNTVITMHSIIYRTQFLRDINYKQVEGVYYSDSQFSLIPLQFAKTIFYVDIPLYGYYIGREDQSINVDVMVKNQTHQLKVLYAIIENLQLDKIENKSIYHYALFIVRSMIMWQALIVCNDCNCKNKRKQFLKLMKDIKKDCPQIPINKIYSSVFFIYVRLFRGLFFKQLINFGAHLYSRFKKNIMAEWD